MLFDKLEEYDIYFSQQKTGWFILILTLFITGMGLIVLSSASLSFIKTEDYFFKQLIWLIIGIPFFLLGSLVRLEFLKKYSTYFLILSAIALIAVLIPKVGKLVNGSRRWISLGGINIQVSEFVKIAVILWVAKYLNANIANIKTFWQGFAIPLICAGIICGLIFLEPDYGTAMLIGSVTFTLLFLAGTRLFYLLMALFCGTFGVAVLIYLNPSRMRRITSFIDIENNKLDGAYQLWQGMLAFTSGGLTGKGLGYGRQQLAYLPEAHTDFIFAIFSEEFGGIMAIVILLLYSMLFLVITYRSSLLEDNFLKFVSYGISYIIVYQVIINVGVVLGLLPTKGMVLPLMSYGGSNLILLLFMIGIVLNCFSSGIKNRVSQSQYLTQIG